MVTSISSSTAWTTTVNASQDHQPDTSPVLSSPPNRPIANIHTTQQVSTPRLPQDIARPINDDEPMPYKYSTKGQEYIYYDHANVDHPPLLPSSESPTTIPFPVRLHRVLDTPKNATIHDIISWSDNGRSLVIKDKKRLVSEIFAQHFKLTQWASFLRQLNNYGFQKAEKAIDIIFYHERFLRGRPELANSMPITPNRERGKRQKKHALTLQQINTLPPVPLNHDITSTASQPTSPTVSNESYNATVDIYDPLLFPIPQNYPE